MRSRFAVVAISASILVGAADPYDTLGLFAQALHHIERNHVHEVDLTALVHGAIRGMVDTLDRRSRFHDPEQVAELRARWDALTGGVGIDLVAVDDGFVIDEVVSGSSAAKRFIKVGDRLVTVDGEALAGLDLAAAEATLRGPTGSWVKLGILRKGESEPTSLSLKRAPRPERTVVGRQLEAGPAYVAIRRFAPTTARELDETLAKLDTKPGLVLDLRDNTGGVFSQAVRVADRFLSKGVIVSTTSRRAAAKTERARPGGALTSFETVVLVNGRTASAAEVVVAALSENRRATTVGTQTYGKGTVQTTIELEDGSAITLTVAEYRSPSGRAIDGVGIRPDVVVPPSFLPDDPSADRQLGEAVRRLR